MGLLLGGGHRHTPHGMICLMVTLFYDISGLGWGMRSTEWNSGLLMKRPAFTGKDNKQHDSLAWLSTISFSVQCHTRFFLTMCMSIIRPSVGTPSLFLTFVFCRGTVLLYGDTPRSVAPCKRLTDWQLLKAADYSTCDQHQRACMTRRWVEWLKGRESKGEESQAFMKALFAHTKCLQKRSSNWVPFLTPQSPPCSFRESCCMPMVFSLTWPKISLILLTISLTAKIQCKKSP